MVAAIVASALLLSTGVASAGVATQAAGRSVGSTAHFLSVEDFEYALGGASKRFSTWDPNDTSYNGQIPCTASKCVTLDEAVNSAVAQGFPSREGIETVYQARKRILVALGRILPRLEIDIGHAIHPAGIFDVFSNLLGFLVPSNWFDWRESKLIYKAEQSSYLGLLRDQVTDTEVLFYNLHRIAVDIEIYKYYAKNVGALVDNIRQTANNSVSNEDVLQLENKLRELNADAAFLDSVLRSVDNYDIAYAMGYEPGEYESVNILPIDLPDLSSAPPIEAINAELESAKAQSDRLQTVRFLRRAAKYAHLSRIFSFLRTGGGGAGTTIGISLGFDIIGDVQIAESEMRRLDIVLKQVASEIEVIYRRTITNANGSVDVYKQYEEAKNANRELFLSVFDRYNREGVLTTTNLLRAIDWAVKFETNRNFVQHYYLTMLSQRNRVTLAGPRYAGLEDRVPRNTRPHGWHDRLKVWEDKEIEHDVEHGELDLLNP